MAGVITPRRRTQFGLLFLGLACAGGLLAVLARDSAFGLRWRSPSITLTGNDRAGRLEVPVLNLWARPGFGADNQVVAQVRFSRDGKEPARLMTRETVDGLAWYRVELADGRSGWVMRRFVEEK